MLGVRQYICCEVQIAPVLAAVEISVLVEDSLTTELARAHFNCRLVPFLGKVWVPVRRAAMSHHRVAICEWSRAMIFVHLALKIVQELLAVLVLHTVLLVCGISRHL
jgi:hypothetical protein